MATERTHDSAWKAIDKRREEAVIAANPTIANLVSESLVKEIFELEWSSQFDDERGSIQHKIKQIVNDRIEELKLKGHEQ